MFHVDAGLRLTVSESPRCVLDLSIPWYLSANSSGIQARRDDNEREGVEVAVTDLKATGKWEKGSRAKRWEVDWYDSSNSRKRKRFRTKVEADDFDAEVHLNSGGARDRSRAASKSVDEVHSEWIKYLSVYGGRSHDGASPSTIGGYESIHAQWIAPTLGSIRLGKLDRASVEAWRLGMVSAEGRGPSPRQRGVADDQLVRLLNWCIDQGYLGENPAKTRSGGRAPRPISRKAKEHIYLEGRQVWRLAACAPDVMTRNLILVMANTGLRFGEAAALRVGDFDPDSGDLFVSKALAMDKGKVYESRTKTHETRTVTISEWVLDLLIEQVEGKSDESRVFSTVREHRDLNRDNWSKRSFGPAARQASTAIATLQAQLGVSERKRGRAWFGPQTAAAVGAASSSQSLRDVLRTPGEWFESSGQFDQAVKVIQAKHGGDGFQVLRLGDVDFSTPTPHDLRHTAASHAIASGASVIAVQKMLGHADAKMTLNTYAGLFEDDRVRLGAAMARALARPE
ncbi:tyrosine-type recombinase/integrase [Brevibacterium casei]|uniref:Site-specific integrase n=1 Tax=Brevibacterium casei TaxID=33889 RepID=A0A7T4DL65_9MICO|nr:tyrosine-type recombinase/integrase [Brevibacterium casei]QQB15574.1 site-specific integrase [Brevibacterium casei]